MCIFFLRSFLHSLTANLKLSIEIWPENTPARTKNPAAFRMKLKRLFSIVCAIGLLSLIAVVLRLVLRSASMLREREKLAAQIDDVWAATWTTIENDRADMALKSLPLESRRTLHSLCLFDDRLPIILAVLKEFKKQVCSKNFAVFWLLHAHRAQRKQSRSFCR